MITIKKIVVFFMLLCLTLSGCKDTNEKPGGSHVASFIVVLSKFRSNANEYWIKAYEPANSSKNEFFELRLENENEWNALKEEKKYFAEYILYKDTRKGILMRYKDSAELKREQ